MLGTVIISYNVSAYAHKGVGECVQFPWKSQLLGIFIAVNNRILFRSAHTT